MRKPFLIAFGTCILLLGGFVAAWIFFFSQHESVQPPETPEAQLHRISAAFLRAHLAELRNSAMVLQFQMEGEELLQELERR